MTSAKLPADFFWSWINNDMTWLTSRLELLIVKYYIRKSGKLDPIDRKNIRNISNIVQWTLDIWRLTKI